MRYDIEPCPKPRQTRADVWKKRPRVLRYRSFADKCKLRRVHIPQPCTIVFFLSMPKTWSKKKREEMAGKPHLGKPDLDNLLKALCDAVCADDSHIWSVYVEKRWSHQGWIDIQPIGDVRI